MRHHALLSFESATKFLMVNKLTIFLMEYLLLVTRIDINNPQKMLKAINCPNEYFSKFPTFLSLETY